MNIIIKPIITEKVTKLGEKAPRYGFFVNPDANKIQIKNAVAQMYNVSVASVNTIIQRGKSKSRYTKAGFVSGKRSNVKKAIVTLKAGDAIDFYANI
ncbi:MAG: 50S ribosomal protein L23 [Bacteroidia bacterium]|nr:50S ribosomal protein L23 [Bacteroidia bacterium]HQV00318.1 50S ribosomal protein L23 [Bacteroidia bacterium]